MHRLALAALTLALAFAPAAAYADTITNTFTFAPLAGYSDESGSSFAQFNPLLGTLNSVTLNFGASATFSGGPTTSNLALYRLRLGHDIEDAPAASFGNGTSLASLDMTYTDVNANYIGTGNLVSIIEVINATGSSASLFSTFQTESLTYNYTPAAPVAVTPEPSSLALLGTGILGMAGVLKRRFA